MDLRRLILLLLIFFHLVSGFNSDRFALLAFRASISSDPAAALADWNPSDVSHCSWNGILCSPINHEHRVVGINLPDKSLSGFITRDLQALSQLERINLRNNSFSGSIPTEIFSNIPTLHKIILGSNRLSGSLPKMINLINLEFLDASSNLLEGSIPAGLKNLEHLNLSRNMLSGNIPRDISLQPGSASLDLSENKLTGPIPRGLQNVQRAAFAGNAGLCGVPLDKPCGSFKPPPSVPGPSSPARPPWISATQRSTDRDSSSGGLSVKEILAIAVGDAVGIILLGLVFIYCFRSNKLCDYLKKRRSKNRQSLEDPNGSSSASHFPDRCLRCLCCCCFCEGSDWLHDDSGNGEGELVLLDTDRDDRLTFDLEDLLRASAYVLSKGASGGIVYKAVLESGVTLAVRRLAGDGSSYNNPHKKQKVFDAEVQIIGRIKHPCIVKLRGYYSGPDEKLLVYDYIANGTLATALHGQVAPYNSLTSLTWAERVKIARRVAEGLSHIHESGGRRYVHGDLRPKNILLSSNMEAYIADFGLNRLITISGSSAGNSRSGSRNGSSSSSVSLASQVVLQQGSGISFGVQADDDNQYKEQQIENEAYRPPESRLGSSKPTQKWDVYAFGVMLLELISGRSATQHLKQDHHQLAQRQKQQQKTTGASSNEMDESLKLPLVEWAQKMWEGKRPVYELLDPTLMHGIAPQQKDVAEFLKIALSCIVVASELRPKMKQVTESLKKLSSG